MPKTFVFTPEKLKTDPYDLMSSYLQRQDSLALGNNGRHLVTLMLRKILGSSSFAVAQTLNKMLTRLETQRKVDATTLDDIDGFEAEADAWREEGSAEAGALEGADQPEKADPAKLQAEINELRCYRDLATSIAGNAKGRALLDCLPNVLTEIEAKGGRRKAVIFTESVRTQSHLRDLLALGLLICLRLPLLRDSRPRTDGGDDEQSVLADGRADGAVEAVFLEEPWQAQGG